MFVSPLGVPQVNQPGFSATTSVLGAGTTGGLRPTSTLANPFPQGISQPTGSSLGLSTFLGQSITLYNPNPLNPYSIRWTLDVQRQLTESLVFEIGYTGNHSVHLPVDRQINWYNPAYLSTSPLRDQATVNRQTANVPNPFAGLLPGTSNNGSTIQFQQLIRQYPQFGNVTVQGLNDGSSYFHGIQARLEKRFSHGLSALVNFQHGRVIELRSRLNDFGPLEKRPADIDRPNRFVASASYDLPFGRGKALFGDANGVVNRIVGGWTINGIYSYETGAPAGDWGNIIYYGGDLQWNPRGVDRAFDVTRFERTTANQLANNIRTFPTKFSNLRQDAMNNFDSSIIKNIPITERVNFQLRGEAFNTFNHAVFARPEISPTNTNFGTITGVTNLERHLQIGARLNW